MVVSRLGLPSRSGIGIGVSQHQKWCSFSPCPASDQPPISLPWWVGPVPRARIVAKRLGRSFDEGQRPEVVQGPQSVPAWERLRGDCSNARRHVRSARSNTASKYVSV
jgi:hypothetical protein